MSNEDKNKNEDVFKQLSPEEEDRQSLLWFESGRRVRSVDFSRIEDNRGQKKLTPFELEVKKKLASSPSPYDVLAKLEEDEERKREEQKQREKLATLVDQARLTPRQRECYQLLHVEKLSEEKIQERLGITQSRLAHYKREIEDVLVATYQKSLRRSRSKRNRRRSSERPLTDYQKEILDLHDRKGLKFREIAEKLGIKKQTVHVLYRRSLAKYRKR